MADHVDPYRLYIHYPQAKFDASFDEGSGGPGDSCGLADYYCDETRAVENELTRLFDAFSTEVYYARRHYAPSASWRDEIATRVAELPVPQRFVVRLHLFEKNQAGQPGRYLGFVSLRPPHTTEKLGSDSLAAKYALRYVIDAELGLPSYMQRPRYHVLTTTAAAPRLGVLPFRSAVYSAAGLSERRGAACVHLAVSQALHLIMGRFGCRPISQVEFELHLWKAVKRHEAAGLSIGQVSGRGARLHEALKVIRRSCNGGGFQMTVEPREHRDTDQPDPNRLSRHERVSAARRITDALSCGLPVIALVRAGNLLKPEAVRDIQDRHADAQDLLDTPHAVLILGMHLLHRREEFRGYTADGAAIGDQPPPPEERLEWKGREDLAELPGRLIIHDALSRGPYFECMMSDFLDAAEAACDGEMRLLEEEAQKVGKPPPEADYYGVHMLVVGPRNMRLGHHQARFHAEHEIHGILRDLEANSGDPGVAALRRYLSAVGVPLDRADRLEDWLLICRLLSTPEVRSRYHVQAGLKAAVGQPDDLQATYYWVVEVRHPLAGRHRGNLPLLGPADLPPAMVMLWDSTQKPLEPHLGVSPHFILHFDPSTLDSHGHPA